MLPARLHGFLSSLEPITATSYQIRSSDGNRLYISNSGFESLFHPDLIDDITCQIIADREFTYTSDDPLTFLCGCPVAIDTETPTALLAYGSRGNGRATDQHRRQLKNHLHHAVSLIEENIGYQTEIQELAYQLEHSFEDLYLYSQISDQVKSLTLSKQMLNNIMMNIVENMSVDAAFINLFKRAHFDTEIFPPDSGVGSETWGDFLYHLQTLTRPTIDDTEENYIIINNSADHPPYEQLAPSPYRFLMVGVRHQGDLFGCIGLASFNMREIFRQGELRMLKSLAEQMAIVIANTDLYRDLEQFTVNMVHALVHAIEAKDPYTRGHSERVHHLTMLIAKQIGLRDEDFEALKWAAILHDIGKIGISEQILLKPGKLCDNEYALIKAHPEKGGRILKPVAQLAASLGGIVHHHERYDGKGYPYGLKGEEIPLAARIIAVADTYDAVTSNRTYRKAKTCEQAMQIIGSVAGTQLDPQIVKIFEQLYASKRIEPGC